MYILGCVDGTTYVGSTVDLERRLVERELGEGAAYTRTRRPVKLLYAEEYDRVDEAFAREKQVQNWSRAKRLALIAGEGDRLPGLSRRRFS